MKRFRPLGILALGALLSAGSARAEGIVWHPWSNAIFAQARREHKFVLLDLEAVWCHWCHVMDDTTYRDAQIAAQIGANYLAVRVDQDARPDLASRYEDYGWPATVIYGPDGAEIVKKQGYLPPAGMARLLREVVADPSPVRYRDSRPEPPAATDTVLSAERRSRLRQQWMAGYDEVKGGWGFSHKYLDWDNAELALREAARGDATADRRGRDTLRLQRKLVDPVWGGVYQYSVDGDWNEPHFEKIMPMQAEDLRIYAVAYAQWADPADRATAEAIHGYLHAFLTGPGGAFYVSQDADLSAAVSGADYYAWDDRGRRAHGYPRIDQHRYARENGWALAGLAELAAVTGESAPRTEAIAAADWVIAHRALPGGGFRHDDQDAAGPYLGDTLAMGRAFLALDQLTADARWLARASAAADFIRAHFARVAAEGFASSDTSRPTFPAPRPEFDENVALVRFSAGLAAATGNPADRALGAQALRWLLTPGLAEERGYYVAGLLLAEEEARTDPLHIAIVGAKDDPAAQALFAAALRSPTAHKLVEWWDRREGPAPRGEAIYPELPEAAAFVCDHGACSLPIATPAALERRLVKLLASAP
jgi:uncharacterized protein YyaL (SSP411 family)